MVGERSEGPLVAVKELMVHFHTHRGTVRAVDGIDLRIDRHRTLGIVGESGCGKSITAMAMLGLVNRKGARITGEINLHRSDGSVVDVNSLPPTGTEIRRIRGSEIAMIFQEPMTSLNPVYTVGDQIAEAILLHQPLSPAGARARAIEILDKVGIPSPEKRVDDYPHQLSGGMRQRVMIAMALSCNPSLLVADEPTTALDVTIQAQILELMKSLQKELGTAIMLITHDLGVIAGMADDVVVMYLGQIVESGPVRKIFRDHLHPYTEGLLGSIPVVGRRAATRRLRPIRGMVPDARKIPTGCRFASRCPYRMEQCSQEPPLVAVEPGHSVRCWLYQGEGQPGGRSS